MMTYEKPSRRSLIKAGVTLGAGVLAAPLVARHALGADPIKVGSLLDLSGPIGASGQAMFDTIQLAVAEVNAAGGLLGRPVELVNYDTQSTIQLYSQYAQQLALRDKVAVVHGGITSASREAIRPVFDRYKMLYFYNVPLRGRRVRPGYVLHWDHTGADREQAGPLRDGELRQEGLHRRRRLQLRPDHRQVDEQIRQGRRRHGRRDRVFSPLDVTDFSATISKIQRAAPAMVLSALVGANHTAFYRQWTAAGMKSRIPIASTTFGLVNEVATLDPAESNGIVTSYGYYQEIKTPASTGFVDKLHAKFGNDMPYISELACATYEGFMLWAEGVRKAGAIERDKLIPVLESGISVDGPSGKVSLDNKTHHAVRNAYLAVAKDKLWDVLKSYPDQQPSDTAAVCDLVAAPNTNKQFVIEVSN